MPQLYMKDLYQAFSLNSKTSICTTAGSKVMAQKPRIHPENAPQERQSMIIQ